jgi:phosphatidylinositol 4-kinase
LKQEPEEEEEEGAQGGPAPQQDDNQEPRKQSLLLRLFESKLFDPALAMNYLFITKEPGVLEYIGNRLFRQETISVQIISQ